MISYIKEYGITNTDYEYILHNVRTDIIETLTLCESSTRSVLEYYNSIGIKQDIAKIILYRPDLIIISKENLEDLINKIDIEVFKNLVSNAIEDLIILGI